MPYKDPFEKERHRKEYRQRPEVIKRNRELAKKYRETHREKCRLIHKKFYYSHLEKCRERARDYAKKHQKGRAEYSKKWCMLNKEHVKRTRKKYYKKNKNRIFLWYLKRYYDLTFDQYNMILKNQKFCCGICKKKYEPNDQKFHIDHNHDTNTVRGVLCRSCNHLLGCAKDSTDILYKAIRYLKKHQ